MAGVRYHTTRDGDTYVSLADLVEVIKGLPAMSNARGNINELRTAYKVCAVLRLVRQDCKVLPAHSEPEQEVKQLEVDEIKPAFTRRRTIV